MKTDIHKSEPLSGDIFVMDFTKPGEPEIYFKKQEPEILIVEGKEGCIMIEKVNLK